MIPVVRSVDAGTSVYPALSSNTATVYLFLPRVQSSMLLVIYRYKSDECKCIQLMTSQ